MGACHFHFSFTAKIGAMNQLQKILLIFSLSCLTIACGPKTANDQALATDIQAKLYANDVTRAAGVKVAVADGVVTLSGDVPNADVALQAMNVANATAGIKSVNNQMKVAEAAAPPPPPPPDSLGEPAPRPKPARVQAPAPIAQVTPPPPMPSSPPPELLPPPMPQADTRPPQHDEMTRRDAEQAPPPPPRPVTFTIPAGESISVRMVDGIDSRHNQEGETFRASLSAPITDGDRVIVPAGTPATVLLANAESAGRIKGRSELELRLTSIDYHGAAVRISSSAYDAKGSSRGKQSAVRTGLGAAAGALIGGLAGGGKGAAIGAAAGGGAGAGYQLATHGQQIKIPSETQITFRLEAPLVLTHYRQ
jgi:hypothetical protein